MAKIFNGRRVRGVRVLNEGATLFNMMRVRGVRVAADGVLFDGGQQTIGIDVLDQDRAIWNEQLVMGVVVIADDRPLYNGMEILPASALTGSLGGNILQPYYDSNTIGIHLRRDGATPPGGPVTAIANEGGAEALFNAAVVGTPIPLTGNYLESTTTTGYPVTANPADLIGVRLMWVMRMSSATGTYRFFGRNEGANTTYIRTGSGTSIQMLRTVDGVTLTATFTGLTPTTAARLLEIETTASAARLFINGVLHQEVAIAFPTFRIDRILQGPTSLQAFEGGMGDVLGVVTGQADTDGAIAAVRYYLDQRFALGLGFPQPASPNSIPENWRLGITGPVVDSTGDTALAGQIAASPTAKTLPAWASTRTITIPVAAVGSRGGLAVWYASDPAVHTLEQSFNGTDWSPLTVRKGLVGGALPHRVAAIPAGPARTLRFSGAGVSGFGLFSLPSTGMPDLWLQAGASHTSVGAAPLAMREAAIAAFPNRDPIFLSYSESAQTSDTITSNILAGAAQVPEARLCLAETGGNNVSQKKPFNPADNLNLAGSIQNMLDGLEAAGVTTYLESIAYRPYPETLDGERNDLGSLPFNTQIVYPEIEARIPFAFDPTLGIARIDNYNLMWVHRDKFDTDNVHPTVAAGYPIQRAFWVDTALRHAYTGQWPKPYAVQAVEAVEADQTYAKWYNASVITRDLPATAARTALIARVEAPSVREPSILNGATLEVERAEDVRTQIAKDHAQAFVDRVSDAVYPTQKANLQSRLDAIVITTSRTALVSFGVNAVAAPAQTSGSVSSPGVKIADILDIDSVTTGWSLNVETGYGFTASSGGFQPSPNETGYPLDLLLAYGSYGTANNPVFAIGGLNPAKRYRLASVLSRASGTGRQTITANGVSTAPMEVGNLQFAELVIENITPIDLGSGQTGIRVSMTTLDGNSAYAGFRLTESDPA